MALPHYRPDGNQAGPFSCVIVQLVSLLLAAAAVMQPFD